MPDRLLLLPPTGCCYYYRVVRVVSYNILDGGLGRADPLAEVIEAQRADVVVLVEADEAEVIDRITRRLGMDCVVAPGRGHSIAVLSRWTIVQSVNHAILRKTTPRCLLEVLLRRPEQVGSGGVQHRGPGQVDELSLLALHCTAGADEASEARREVELADVMRLTANWRAQGRPHLLAGDFNANSPTQRIDLARCKPSTRAAAAQNRQAADAPRAATATDAHDIPRRAIAAVLRDGYTDTLCARLGSQADGVATFSTHFPGQRVDYIFAHGLPAGAILDAWIEQDRLATFASDHYPVGTDLTF